jgi:regulator of replication initiation timing
MKITAGGLTVTGNLYVSGTITAGSSITGSTVSTPAPVAGNCCASDIRLKHNIVPLTDALGKINKLRGVYFHWNTSIDAVSAYSEKRHVGVIAQEVQAVLPEIVANATKDYLGVDYAFLTPLLIEGIKDLTNTTDSLYRFYDESFNVTANDTATGGVEEESEVAMAALRGRMEALKSSGKMMQSAQQMQQELRALHESSKKLIENNRQLRESNSKLNAEADNAQAIYEDLVRRVKVLEEKKKRKLLEKRAMATAQTA